MENNSFVMYSSFYTTYKQLKKRNPTAAQAFMDAILDYGFNGEIPDNDSELWIYGLDTVFTQMDACQKRYEKCKNSGGGRPCCNVSEDQIYEAMKICDTWKEVANELDIGTDTLRKLRNEYGILFRTPVNYRMEAEKQKNRKTEQKNRKTEAEKQKNLNYNYNYNYNLNNNYIISGDEENWNESVFAQDKIQESKKDDCKEAEKIRKTKQQSFSDFKNLSLDCILNILSSEDDEIIVRDQKITNLTTGEVIHLTEESWRNYENFRRSFSSS